MTEGLLQSQLAPVLRRQRQVRFWKRAGLGGLTAAGVVLAILALQVAVGGVSPWWKTAALALGMGTLVGWLVRRSPGGPDLRSAATLVEAKFPELNGLVLTAVQQSAGRGESLNYLQRCLIRDAVVHSRTHDWRQAFPTGPLVFARAWGVLGLAALIAALAAMPERGDAQRARLLARAFGVQVTPGDATLEKGENLVVLARFGSQAPASAELVIGATPATERRIPLTRSLSDPVFGGTIPEVSQDFVYRIEYEGRRTPQYSVSVFEYPRLERADATLTFPSYTGQASKTVEDTRRVTAVEGTTLDLALQLNKSVSTARLVPRDRARETLALVVATNRAAASLPAHVLAEKGSYELQLVDADGRTNKVPAQFVFDVLPNRVPELKLVSPRGDVRPSALEEVRFDGTVWDDFGVLAHGLAVSLIDQEPRVIELGREVPRGERRGFQHLLQLEDYGVEPDQLVSWYAWADDIGPDGKVRRTTTDLLFAEIRPFEEIYREGDSGSGESQQQGQQGGQQGAMTELIKLQKQIVSATWKIQRGPKTAESQYRADVDVVKQSQQEVMRQAEEQSGEAGPQVQPLWETAVEAMATAVVRLGEAESKREMLSGALNAEQAAYQALLKLQQREMQVARARSQQGGGGGGEGRNQAQLDELELAQSENRYETQRQAQAPSTPERREQLQVLNRLQELARRQQDVTDRLKELQTALREARTEQEKEELRRQLKRLQEEQRQMLADMDELDQRSQRPENQSRMSEMRDRMEQTRNDMQQSAEATGDGALGQAIASGTRAQRQLQELRDELRQRNSSEFAEDLRQMRADARDLERRQQEIEREIGASQPPGRRSLSSETPAPENVAQKLAEQRQKFTNLVDRATQMSQAAEASEPLVSENLYDALRQLSQLEASSVEKLQQDLVERGRMTRGLYERLQAMSGENGRSVEAAAEMIRQGMEAEAREASRRAQGNMQTLRKGIDQAAESVLGDDTSALRLARDELQNLSEQLEREISEATRAERGGAGREGSEAAQDGAQGAGNPPGERGDTPADGTGAGREVAQGGPQQRPGSPGEAGQDPAAPGRGGAQEQARATNPPRGEGQEPGQGQGQGQGQGEGQSPAQAQAQAQGQGQGQGRGQGQGQGREGGEQRPREMAQAPGQGQGQGQGQGRNPGTRERGGASGSGGGNGGSQRGGRAAGFDLDTLFGGEGDGGTRAVNGPLTTEGFGEWSDRLREVEEMIDLPDLRNDVATARSRAQLTRTEVRREMKKPDWAVVRLEILRPLVEVRRQLDEELARRSGEDQRVAIDRDPVPNKYTELVRRYYEQLGK